QQAPVLTETAPQPAAYCARLAVPISPRGQSATEPPTTTHHFASAWALLARYQAIVLERPVFRSVGGDQPPRACFIRATSSTFIISPSGLSVFQEVFPRKPVPALIVSTSSRIEVPLPVPMLKGRVTSW